MDKGKKVIAFIPAFNEEESISSVIETVRKIYSKENTLRKNYILEILVVDDGSTDKTNVIAKKLNVHLVEHHRNRGLGAATRSAMIWAYEFGADVAVKLDADFQHDPQDIEKVIMPILRNECDICWGSRFAGKIHYKMPVIRFLGNKFFTWLMNLFTEYEITDAQTGLMAFGKKYLAVFEIFGNYNPPQQLLLDAHYKYMRYSEVPVDFYARTSGKSFVSLKYPFHVTFNILRMLIYASPIKTFSVVGAFFILFSISYFLLNVYSKIYHWNIQYLFVENLSQVTLNLGLQCFFFGILADLIIRKRR